MEQIQTLINNSKNILVVSHIRPDWDAICSAISTYAYLIKTQPNKKVDMAFSSFPSKQYEGIKYADKILWVDDIAQIIEDYDLVIFVDANEITRFSDTLEFTNITAKTLCLDHHPDSNLNYDFKIVDTNEGSSAGLIYKLLFRDNKELLDKELADIILLGILSDTGSFSFLTYKKTASLDYAKELLEISKNDIQTIQQKLTQIDLEDLELIKILLNNLTNIQIEGFGGISYSYYPLEVRQKYESAKLKAAKDKFVFTFLRQITGYPWGFVVIPYSVKEFTISFRSLPEGPDVNVIAQKFGGGGHVRASGADITYQELMTSQQVCEDIISKLKH